MAWLSYYRAIALAFAGLNYSLFPHLVLDKVTTWDAASATSSVTLVLRGFVFTLPAIFGCTVSANRMFLGKTRELRYD